MANVITQTIKLEITPEEAHALVAILTKVGGDPEKSDRRHTNKVLHAIKASAFGLQSYETLEPHTSLRYSVSFFFENNTGEHHG